MKFQLDPSLSEKVKDWARDHLGVDENCNSDCGDSYDINTLYLDTPDLDLFHRTGVIGPAKHRIRRYGGEQTLWLETKRKKRMVVKKNRTAVFESDLRPRLLDDNMLREIQTSPLQPGGAQSESPSNEIDPWCGDWFLKRITERRLTPAIQVAYRRFARTATLHDQNLRLTIDSKMAARTVDGWNVAGASTGASDRFRPIGDCEILELKFHNQMPHLFQELLRTFVLPAAGFSKYRAAIESCLSARGLLTNSSLNNSRLTNYPQERGTMSAQMNDA